MAIKKVTVEDLKNVRGGGKVEKAEKKAAKEISKETGEPAKDIKDRNKDLKGKKGGTDTVPPGKI